MRTLLKEILEQLNGLKAVVHLHNEVLRVLLEDSIAKDDEIFADIDEEAKEYMKEVLKND